MIHRNSQHDVAWNGPSVSDKAPRNRSDPLQRREHMSANAFARGLKWYARALLEAQQFPNNHVASSQLIAKSRRLLAKSEIAIRRTKTTLAFHGRSRKYVN